MATSVVGNLQSAISNQQSAIGKLQIEDRGLEIGDYFRACLVLAMPA